MQALLMALMTALITTLMTLCQSLRELKRIILSLMKVTCVGKLLRFTETEKMALDISKVQGDSEGERKRAEDSFTAPAVSTASNEYLHITAPIAETEGFAMEIGSLANPGRQSQSILEVLENGYYLGKPVTKVRLTLLSGRRHQLRLHTKFIGYPIVGDVAYTGDSDAERMMLHAFQLTIPLTKGKELARGRLAFLPDEIKAESPDPFVFTDGNLS